MTVPLLGWKVEASDGEEPDWMRGGMTILLEEVVHLLAIIAVTLH